MSRAESSTRLVPKWLFRMALGFGLILIGIGPFLWLQFQLHQPYKGYPQNEIVIKIPRGETVGMIARSLEEQGVITSSRLFRLHVRLSGASFILKAGEYKFDHPLSLIEVVEKIREGSVYYHQITIPEGLEMLQIANLFVRAGFGTTEGFRDAMEDQSLIFDLDPKANHLEGYLFPETYSLTSEMKEVDIVGLMVRNFRAQWTADRSRRARKLGLTVRDVTTLASLIEKETALDHERPLVSAVFHNRLKRNMKLACDPTVIYAVKQVKQYDGVINQSDLRLDSPYNTYIYAGLPPGPIANPGENAIQAALYPAEAEFLYFVSRNDGSHVFSTTYGDHSRAVRRYQR